MEKISIYLPISFFLICMGCIMFTNSYDEIWITIRNVSFVLSGLILLIGCMYVQKTGEIVESDGDWGTGIFSGDGGDGGE